MPRSFIPITWATFLFIENIIFMPQLLGHLAGVCRVREQHCHQDNEPAAWQILPATVAYDLARQRQYKLGWGSCSITLVSKMTFLFFLRQAAAVPSTPPSSLAAAVTTTLVADDQATCQHQRRRTATRETVWICLHNGYGLDISAKTREDGRQAHL